MVKLLIDTNIVIPLEPTILGDLEANTPQAARFSRLASLSNHQLYVHPSQRTDIANDRNAGRRQLREQLIQKYPLLAEPPSITHAMKVNIGEAIVNSHDWVDDQLLASVFRDAVAFLITEDDKIHKKAGRLSIGHRVLKLSDAIEMMEALMGSTSQPPPAINSITAYQLDETDPIFNSFREDYPEFDNWLRKCKLEHRQAWIVDTHSGEGYSGVCIVNEERDKVSSLSGKILKICTIKVAEEGFFFGELLLKTIFEFARVHKFDWIYVEVFPKYNKLIELLVDHGFEETGSTTTRQELRLAKPIFAEEDRVFQDVIEYNRRVSPTRVQINDVQRLVIPIKPKYHTILFPDSELQSRMFPGERPYGNSIRKAYLCNAGIRDLKVGDLMFFYRSADIKAITAVGYLESFAISDSPEFIVEYVGRRTVYSYEEIAQLCTKPVLALLFRQLRLLQRAMPLQELIEAGILKAAPQSITRFTNHNEWIQNLLNE